MPKQNRPLVRDGRLQPIKKKRTDRSYLGGASGRPALDEPTIEEHGLPEGAFEADTAPEDALPESPVDTPDVQTPPPPVAAAAPSPRAASGRVPTTVRAIQHQGVRRRRELDVDALAERDTRYAMHELRRILVLATIVVVTLIVLGIVLR